MLHFEDNTQDAELVRASLEAGGLAGDIVRVCNQQQFEARIADGRWDLVLLAHNPPDKGSLSLIKLIRDKQPTVPVIVISGVLGEEEAVKCLQMGASDYLLKRKLHQLPSAAERAIEEAERRLTHQREEEAIAANEQVFR